METEQGPPSQDEIPPGTIIADRYKVVKQLGQGGMGVVFQVEHVLTHRRLAIKAMRQTRDASFRERFMTEARAACAVTHPAVVAVHDVFENDGRVMMVMDFLDGHDLYDLVQQRPGQRIHIQEAAAHLLPIVSALGALHAANLVHRDIKPENIFISNGKSFLLDLGVAKDLQASVRLTQTTTGRIVETPDVRQRLENKPMRGPSRGVPACPSRVSAWDPDLVRPAPSRLQPASRREISPALPGHA